MPHVIVQKGKIFFQHLNQAAALVGGSWILLGDFNMYRSAHEKSRGCINWSVMEHFNSWIREHGLDDIPIANRKYTWSNKRREPTLVKLDRVLVNAEWNLGFFQTVATAIMAATSDHALFIVEFSKDTTRSNFFRFENFWLDIEEVRGVISEGWTRGTRAFAVTTSLISIKMRRIRAAIRKWGRSRGSVQLLMENNKHVVDFLNAVEEYRTLSNLEFCLRDYANKKVQQLILWQTSIWRRRAKIRQCTLGDENTRFFHAAANSHSRRNKIRVLVKDGIEFFDDEDKLRIATEYFNTLFGQASPSVPVVDISALYDPIDLSSLEEQFSWAEIVSAINRSPNNRSPGPDGFTNEFYKCFKETLKPDLLNFFSDFHANNADLSGVNSASISCCLKRNFNGD
uniref:Endonuclease/exonuclease/phosphatase domain-containing protein n=1 Tax=Aegilops tauschii subsp. strangulata TaxID=200361 RepID=A0A453EL83_AEGTS